MSRVSVELEEIPAPVENFLEEFAKRKTDLQEGDWVAAVEEVGEDNGDSMVGLRGCVERP